MRRVAPFLFAAALLFAQDRRMVPLGSDGKRVALVMGNDSYTGLDKLANAQNDARSIGEALTAAGFQVTQIADTKLEGMELAVNAIIRSIGQNDVAMFYYSGHAVEIDGQNLLIPIDLSADLLGNVYQWTADSYDASEKVVRGSSWCDGPRNVRAFFRFPSVPTVRDYSVGFACVGDGFTSPLPPSRFRESSLLPPNTDARVGSRNVGGWRVQSRWHD